MKFHKSEIIFKKNEEFMINCAPDNGLLGTGQKSMVYNLPLIKK